MINRVLNLLKKPPLPLPEHLVALQNPSYDILTIKILIEVSYLQKTNLKQHGQFHHRAPPLLGNCDICAEQKISFMNETKWYKIWPRQKKLGSKNLLNFTAKFREGS
jgi:hypothetical protein